MVGTTCGALSFGSWLLAESCCAAGPEARWRSGRWRPCRDRTGDLARRAAMGRHGCCRPDAHAPVCQVRGRWSRRVRGDGCRVLDGTRGERRPGVRGRGQLGRGQHERDARDACGDRDGDRCEDAAPGSQPAKQHRGQCEAAGDPAANGGGQAEAGAVERPVVARAPSPEPAKPAPDAVAVSARRSELGSSPTRRRSARETSRRCTSADTAS